MSLLGAAGRVLHANKLVGRQHLHTAIRNVSTLPRSAAAAGALSRDLDPRPLPPLAQLPPGYPLDPSAVAARALRPDSGPSSLAQPPLEHALSPVASEHASIPSPDEPEFWREVPRWKDVSVEDFMSYRWAVKNIIEGEKKLKAFLVETIPEEILPQEGAVRGETRDELMTDIIMGMKAASMAIRVTPYVLSRINWKNPRNDPIFKQFVPVQSRMLPDHPVADFDALDEAADSPVKGLVHRYPDKALFLPISVCPTYCNFCTRSWAVGADTDTLTKDSMKPILRDWEACFAYIESQPGLHDIVVSGGDSYYLSPDQLYMIGKRLLNMPNIKRIRFASKGLAVAPSRILDESDSWTAALIAVSNLARKLGKAMALHTHFNHANEISWITRKASQKLLEAGVVVRNQTVLLRGVNDNVEAMGELIRGLADTNIFPYYVYQCDLVKRIEHHRTPLQTIIDIEAQLRGRLRAS